MSKNDIKVHVDNDVVAVSVEKENKRGEDRDDQGVRYDTTVCICAARYSTQRCQHILVCKLWT